MVDIMDVKQIEQIISLLKQNDVTEFELTEDGTTLKLSRLKPAPLVQHSSYSPYPQHIEPAVVQVHTVSTTNSPTLPLAHISNTEGMTKVESPLVGTFYSKSSPDAESFVKEGAVVKKGDTLCIIEAMKLMNEIEAPISGKIEKAFGKEGQVVEFAEVLFIINPNS